MLGAFFRIDQFSGQVLIDDEWHAVHQLLRLSPAQMFVDFGHADYSIPLGLLYGLPAALTAWVGSVLFLSFGVAPIIFKVLGAESGARFVRAR